MHDMRTWRSKLASQRQQTAWLAGANVEIWTRALTSYRSRMWAWIARTLGRPRCRPLGEPRTGGHWWLLSSPLARSWGYMRWVAQPIRHLGPYRSSRPAASVPATAVPIATTTPEPDPPPKLVDLLGEGSVVAELELGNRSRAVIWCRESVPGTQILSTLALIHIATSRRFGDQVVLYEELTKPWVPGGSFRRGVILETEGLGTANSAAPLPSDQEVDDDADLEAASDGLRCASCAPDRLTVAGGEVLVGSCVHGVPLRVGIVYVIAPPVRPGQTPLALHISCGLTSIRAEGDQIVVSGEAPLVRGLYEARFPFPDISFARERSRFVASDLGLLDWNCDVGRSSHLEDRHLLRTAPERSIAYQRVESAIGDVGVHGPMVLGLTADQCSMLTRAWWDQPDLEDPTGTPIADLVKLEPPAGERDWFYGCAR